MSEILFFIFASCEPLKTLYSSVWITRDEAHDLIARFTYIG